MMDQEDEESVFEPFTNPDEISDVIFIVDEKRIYAHKPILGEFPSFSLSIHCISSSKDFTGIQSNVILQWFS